MFSLESEAKASNQKRTKTIKLIINGDPSKAFEFATENFTVTHKQIINAIHSQWNSLFKGSNWKIRLFSLQGVQYEAADIPYIKNKETIYVSKGEDFDSNKNFGEYQIIEVIGEGGFGCVSLAQNIYTKQKVAIKVLKASRLGSTTDIDMIFREAESMKTLNHPNIVKIINCYTLKDMKMVVMMEYMEGGQLKALLHKKKRFSETEARHYFKQLISAVDYCHHRNIIHRDLKLENILLGNADEAFSNINSSNRKIEQQEEQLDNIKMQSNFGESLGNLSDMGQYKQKQKHRQTGKYIRSAQPSIEADQPSKGQTYDVRTSSNSNMFSLKSRNQSLSSLHKEDTKEQKFAIIKVSDFGISGISDRYNTEIDSGTLKYMAPQILAKKQKANTPAVDIWACGIILFNMIFGRHPFQSPDITKKIIAGEFSFPDQKKTKNGNEFDDDPISSEVKDLIKKLLEIDPKKRVKVWEIQTHPWFTFSSKKSISPRKRQTDFQLQRNGDQSQIDSIQEHLINLPSLQFKKSCSQDEHMKSNVIHFNNQRKPGNKFLKHKPNSLNFNNETELNFLERLEQKKKSVKDLKRKELNIPRNEEVSKFYIPLSSVNGSWQAQKEYKPVESKRLEKEKAMIYQQFQLYRNRGLPNRITPNNISMNRNRNSSANGSRIILRSETKHVPHVPSKQKLEKGKKKNTYFQAKVPLNKP